MDFYETMLLRKANNGGVNLLSTNSLTFKKCLENTLTSVTADMLDGITYVRWHAFRYCSHLESVALPASVTGIGDYAFYWCSSLESLTIYATTPPTLGFLVFEGTSDNLKIYVPAESVETYKTASRWSNRASQIEAIPE